jgi:hypothetical protein
MKQHEITAYDDLDRVEKDSKTRADQTRFVGLDGEWVELDLTDEHDAELAEMIGRYMRAGIKPAKPPAPPRSARFGGKIGEAKARNDAEAEWHRSKGYPYTDRKGGGIYFPVVTHREYLEHLAALEAVTDGR